MTQNTIQEPAIDFGLNTRILHYQNEDIIITRNITRSVDLYNRHQLLAEMLREHIYIEENPLNKQVKITQVNGNIYHMSIIFLE